MARESSYSPRSRRRRARVNRRAERAALASAGPGAPPTLSVDLSDFSGHQDSASAGAGASAQPHSSQESQDPQDGDGDQQPQIALDRSFARLQLVSEKIRALPAPRPDVTREEGDFEAVTRVASARSAAEATLTIAKELAKVEHLSQCIRAKNVLQEAQKACDDAIAFATGVMDNRVRAAVAMYEATRAAADRAFDADVAAVLQKVAVAEAHQEGIAALSAVLNQLEHPPQCDERASERRQKIDQQLVFVCPITQLRLVDPVITPSGRTYERAAIERWLESNSTDPVTRQPLFIDQLVPNLLLKDVLGRFAPVSVASEGGADPRNGALAASVATIPAVETEDADTGYASGADGAADVEQDGRRQEQSTASNRNARRHALLGLAGP
jgi:hypothetical protein